MPDTDCSVGRLVNWRKAGEYGRYKRAIARGWPLGGRSKAAGEASRVFRYPLDRRSEEALQRPGKRDFARVGLRRASRPGPSHLWSAPEHPAWRLDRAGCWGRREGPAKELKKGAVVWQELSNVYTPGFRPALLLAAPPKRPARQRFFQPLSWAALRSLMTARGPGQGFAAEGDEAEGEVG